MIVLESMTTKSTTQAMAGTHHRKFMSHHIEALELWLKDDCTRTLNEMARYLKEKFDLEISTSTISYHLQGFHYSLKPIKPRPVGDEDEFKQERIEHVRKLLELLNGHQERLIYVDECDLSVSYRRIHESRMVKTNNYCKAICLTRNGILHHKLDAEMSNEKSLIKFLNELFKRLQTHKLEKQVIILDEVQVLKSANVLKTVEKHGHTLLLLPSHMAIMNPTALYFYMWESYVREKKPSDENELLNAIERSQKEIPNELAKSCFEYSAKVIIEYLQMHMLV
jgi:hypothetical protein